MRSISLKILLVLIIVSLAGALFTTFFIQYRTRNAFDTFIQNQNQLVLSDQLISYYQQNNSWDNVEGVFKSFYTSNNPGGQGIGIQGPSGQGRNLNRPGENPLPLPAFVLSDQDGIIIGGFTDHPGYQMGDQIPDRELKKSLALENEGMIIAYLAPVPISSNRNSIQQNFLKTVQQGLLISSLVTLLIALILGGILIMSFTRPIRKLANGTERIANGELGYQVAINSSDELGRLAASFNNMSTDLHNADQLRKQMTADIAHDLRTPLSILHGYTEAISEGKITGSQQIYQAMHQQSKHLNFLIEDLRTLSLLDSEELHFQLENIDPVRILTSTFTAFMPLAAKKDISLSLDLEENLPRVMLDPERFTQILGNLISNALNILPRGGNIWLKARKIADKLAIEVVDDGPGIPAEKLPHIFQRHYKIDQSRGQDQGSSGLGLAIAKKLVEAQRGSIEVQSEIGQGSTFRVLVPIS